MVSLQPRCELGVPHGRLNAVMTEIGLQRARVRALVRQGKRPARSDKFSV